MFEYVSQNQHLPRYEEMKLCVQWIQLPDWDLHKSTRQNYTYPAALQLQYTYSYPRKCIYKIFEICRREFKARKRCQELSYVYILTVGLNFTAPQRLMYMMAINIAENLKIYLNICDVWLLLLICLFLTGAYKSYFLRYHTKNVCVCVCVFQKLTRLRVNALLT